VVFYNRETASVDKGRAKVFIYVEISKTFDTVPHNVLASRMER